MFRGLNTVAIRPQTITKDDKRDFMAVFPDIVRDLTQLNPGISDLSTLISKVLFLVSFYFIYFL